jgi:dTDP-glucose 4,6-dehydratase
MFEPDYIAHLGAETHVDRSISDPLTFVNSNILGTFEMLEYARQLPNLKKFLYASTDEIFGDAQEQPFHEWSRYNSRNPYAATKAAAEELALAWQNTYNLPIVISHCSNVFGERQCAEKFIPLLVNEISKNEIVDIHTDQQGVSGDRTWVYVGDVVKAIMAMLLQGKPRTKFNIPGKKLSNLEVASEVARVLDKSLRYRQVYPYHRPGWDFSYNVTGTELSALGWELSNDTSFWDEFRKTVRSYEHSEAYI